MSTLVRRRATLTLQQPTVQGDRPATYCFSVQARAEPGVMPRVLALIAKRGLVPRRWVSQLSGPDEAELTMDFQVADLTADTGAYIARCIEQLQYVQFVLTSQKTAV